MTPDVSEGILRALSSRQVFVIKRVENSKNSVFGHFLKIVKLTTDVLEPSLLSEIAY